MNAQRSGIPKVVGILMIIFASIGLLGSLLGLAGSAANDATMKAVPELKTWGTMSMIFSVVGLGVSALHLVAGISSVKYKANAPKLSVTYALINIINNLVQGIIVFAWLKPAIAKSGVPGAAEMVGGMVVISIVLSVIWPTIVLALMTRPAAKAACVN
jgi:hypothetical protein